MTQWQVIYYYDFNESSDSLSSNADGSPGVTFWGWSCNFGLLSSCLPPAKCNHYVRQIPFCQLKLCLQVLQGISYQCDNSEAPGDGCPSGVKVGQIGNDVEATRQMVLISETVCFNFLAPFTCE